MAEKVLFTGGKLQTDGGTDITSIIDTTASASLARARSENDRAITGGVSATYCFLGNSFTEGYTCTKRGLRWMDVLGRLFNAHKGGATSRYIPASCGTFSSVNIAGDWPGSQMPWSYTGAVAGDVNFGPDLHACIIPTSGTMTITYAGDIISLLYVRTASGPAAAAVTLDGVSVGPINAQGSTQDGQLSVFGTAGDYAMHTLVVTATAAPLTVDGVIINDGVTFGLGVPFGTISTFGFGHSGFTTSLFAPNANWSRALARLTCNQPLGINPTMIAIELGANDNTLGISPAAFKTNLITMMTAIDTEIVATGITTLPAFMFIWMPTVPQPYVDAGYAAGRAYAPDRCDHLDLRAYLPAPSTSWSIFDAGNAHPNDAGQQWIAHLVYQHIVGSNGQSLPQMRANGPVIAATDVATSRLAWTESLGVTLGQSKDTAGAPDTTVRERRHRTWMEAGTYQAIIRYEQVTTSPGTLQVLVGSTSMGTVTLTGTDGTLGETVLGSTVVIDSPGPQCVTIRKTSANGTVRFVRLHLRKQ